VAKVAANQQSNGQLMGDLEERSKALFEESKNIYEGSKKLNENADNLLAKY
jgi:hypothetical protein